MSEHRIFKTAFAKVYPLYVQKAERKGRTKAEVNDIIRWLTGYSQVGLAQQIEQQSDFETFFAQAPAMHPHAALIKGLVCGVRVEEVADPLMQKIRYLDSMRSINRAPCVKGSDVMGAMSVCARTQPGGSAMFQGSSAS
jgi:hypothetical protein